MAPNRLVAALLAASALAACGPAPTEPPGTPPFEPVALKKDATVTAKLQLEQEGYAVVELKGLLEGSSWGTAGAESVVVKVVVDDTTLRHIVWATGSLEHSYGVNVGKLAAGEHQVEITFDPLSPAAGATLQLKNARLVRPEDQSLTRHAPIIFAKDTSVKNDLPHVVYGGRGADGVLRYNAWFTNEDDGTGVDPPLLQARWGRLSDIEWVMETELDASGNVTKSRYQGALHLTMDFKGTREGDQPILEVGSNGTFDHQVAAPSKLKLSPSVFPYIPTGEPRDALANVLPHLNALTDLEVEREGKVDPTCTVATRLWPYRCQLIVDVEAVAATSIAGRRVWGLELQTASGTVKSELDHFSPSLTGNARQDRVGHVRLALPLAPGVEPQALRVYSVADGQGTFSVTVKNVRAYRWTEAGGTTVAFEKPAAEATVSDTVTTGALYP